MRQQAAASWPLSAGPAPYYVYGMKQPVSMPVATTAKILAGAAVLAAATGLAFASWIDHGAAIFMTMVEAGISWCF
jgi:hypothetical protein